MDALTKRIVDFICDDVLPSYDVASEVGRNDVELPEAVRAMLAAAPSRDQVSMGALREGVAYIEMYGPTALAERMNASLASVVPTAEQGVVALRWESEPPYRVARPFTGLHYATEVIWPENGNAFDYVLLSGPTVGSKRFASLTDAQAAAQSDFEKRIRSALTPPIAGAGEEPWQPMETAPKDGTRVLLWMVHANAKYSDNPIDEGWEAAVIAHWIDHNGGGWTWHGLCGVPTRWMPLPRSFHSPKEPGPAGGGA